MEEFRKTLLVRKDRFEPRNFADIAIAAETEIAKAEPNELLALTITMNSPIKVVDAKIYNRDVFDSIIKN